MLQTVLAGCRRGIWTPIVVTKAVNVIGDLVPGIGTRGRSAVAMGRKRLWYQASVLDNYEIGNKRVCLSRVVSPWSYILDLDCNPAYQ